VRWLTRLRVGGVDEMLAKAMRRRKGDELFFHFFVPLLTKM
jgi:hypothetical protein